MRYIATPAAPAARGHYSQALVHGGLVYVAGQLPIDPADAERPGSSSGMPSFDAQARQVLSNVRSILEAAGSDLAHILKATVYITDVAHWPRFDAIYAQSLGGHKPARTVVPVSALHYGYLVEMDVIAALRDS